MTGADVKRQVMEALELLQHRSDDFFGEPDGVDWLLKPDALAPCVVLTAEEAATVAKCLGETEANPSGKDLRPLGDAFKLLIPGYGSSI